METLIYAFWVDKLAPLSEEALSIWLSGGWGMGAIAVIAFVLFSLGIHIYLRLSAKEFKRMNDKTWRRWIDNPEEREGKIGEIFDFVTGTESLKDIELFFEEIEASEIAPFERDLKVMKICVGAAPLLGLLGTVTGMLATFAALALGSGGDKTMEMVASGISEALVTTETGLVIGLAGLFFQYQLSRSFARYRSLLVHLETVCTQNYYKKIRKQHKAA